MSSSSARLEYEVNCGVCGKALVYDTKLTELRCVFCGETSATLIYCPEGHYICDACHRREALDVLRQVLHTSTAKAPSEILELVMDHPSVPMHGPEHHVILPAAIVAAVRNAGYPIPGDAIEKAIARGSKVPGGWCGFYGDCGAAVGVGIAVSVLTQATPLTGKQRALALEATSLALARMVDGHPRCCKRCTRLALEAAMGFLQNKLGINLDKRPAVECHHSQQNKECPQEECPYYRTEPVAVP